MGECGWAKELLREYYGNPSNCGRKQTNASILFSFPSLHSVREGNIKVFPLIKRQFMIFCSLVYKIYIVFIFFQEIYGQGLSMPHTFTCLLRLASHPINLVHRSTLLHWLIGILHLRKWETFRFKDPATMYENWRFLIHPVCVLVTNHTLLLTISQSPKSLSIQWVERRSEKQIVGMDVRRKE